MKKKLQQQARAALFLLLPAVKDVILWQLQHAVIAIVSAAFAVIIVASISQPGPVETTDAEEGVAAGDVLLLTLWCVCVVSQAAAGALALMRPRHRLLLAYAALVATAAGHSIWAHLHRMLVAAHPGRLNFWTGVVITAAIFMCGLGDLICFLGLLLRGGEE